MSKSILRAMRLVRKAKPITGNTLDAWWYVEINAVSVMSQSQAVGVNGVRLTRQQLESAIRIMDEYKESK